MNKLKIIIFVLNLFTFTIAIKIKSLSTQKNTDLFKYDPNDEYTLPEDIDDDKPPVVYQGDNMKAQTLQMFNKNHGKGKFKYSLATQNGIELTQVGKLKDKNTFVVSGSYSYTGADGRRYRVRYTADEFGYHPITELDVEIPEIAPNNGVNNGFQFLRQNLGNNVKTGGNRGNAHIGDDYSYGKNDGYHYDKPERPYLPPSGPTGTPNRYYLPVY